MISFLRPVIFRKPSSSSEPRSPVLNQPSANASLGGLLVAPVAAEHHAAAHQQLAVVGDAHAVARQQRSDRADFDLADLVDRDGRAGLGEAVALVDGQAHTPVEVTQPRAQRCAAGDRRVAVATQRRAQLVVDEPVEKRMLGAQQQPGAAAVVGLAPVDRSLHGLREDRSLAVVGGVLLSRVVDLLEHPGHRHHHRRLEHREHRQQVLDVAGEADGDLVGERGQRQRPGQHMGQWQEDQQPLPFVQQRREALLGSAGLVEQVGMRELAPFRASGGARGVDQCRGIVGLQRRKPGGQLVRIDRRAGLDELVERLGARTVDMQHPAQGRKFAGELGDHRGVCVGFGEHQHGFRVLQHPAHLLCRRGLVDRDGDGADGKDGQVEDRPLVAGGRKNGDPVTGLHAQRDQTQCRGTNLLGGLGARDVGPHPVDLPLIDDKAGVVALVLEDHGRDVVVPAEGDAGRNAVLTHSFDLD